jgi:hypothetical protein
MTLPQQVTNHSSVLGKRTIEPPPQSVDHFKYMRDYQRKHDARG